MKGRYGVTIAVFTFIVLFFSMEARAVDWVFCARATNGTGELYYDPQSIKRASKHIVQVWTKSVCTEKLAQVMTKKLGTEWKELSYSIGLREYNCSEKKSRILSLTFYNQGGGVISGDNDPSPWRSVVAPGSTEEYLFNIVCGGHWKYICGGGGDWFYDTQSVSRGQDTTSVWVKCLLNDKGKAWWIKMFPETKGIEKISYTIQKRRN